MSATVPFGIDMAGSGGGLRAGWRSLSIFAGIDGEALSRLEAAMDRIAFGPSEVLLRQGESGDEMYVLVDGQVRVVVERTIGGKPFELVLGAPAVIGEMAVVTREPRTATVTAEGAVTALRIGRRALDELVASHPETAKILTAIVGERLVEADTLRQVGKYRITGRLGHGAMATVFEAFQSNLDRPVALKMLSHELVSATPEFAERFEREARVVAQLDHEHIVRVHDRVEAYGTQFIVMEKLSGVNLDELIEDDVRLDWDTIRRVLSEICAALDYSHRRGLLHRDIKPSNIFLNADRRVKLLDFGIAIEQEGQAAAGRVVGTPHYMAPEQIRGLPLDGRADIYATGIVAFELVTGVLPFRCDALEGLLVLHLTEPMPDPRLWVPEVPDDLVQFIARATHKDPAERFQTSGLAARFLRAAAERPLVDGLELATLAVAYHPSRRAAVVAALKRAREEIADLDGVKATLSAPGGGDRS